MIPYGRQDIRDSDIESVVRVLRSDFLTQGPAVPRFERVVAARTGAAHAVAVHSATAALHIACMALGLKPGMRLWTVPNTFVASANCARYCGADVDFVDIDARTWNVSVPQLAAKLARARAMNQLPHIVVPVHFAGQPTEQEAVHALSLQFGFRILEDASHSIGATRAGEPVGSCRWSDITVFSFHPVKIITTGEGGMALTNDAQLAERMRMLRTHGITRDAQQWRATADATAETGAGVAADAAATPWYYEQQLLGLNYRMTDVQAALGCSQIERLDEYVERRNRLASRYDALLDGLPLQLPHVLEGNRSAFHLYVVRLSRETLDRRGYGVIFNGLRQRGIGVNLHYLPVHLQPYYRDLGFAAGQYPQAEQHGRSALSLPMYPLLTESQQDQVVAALRELL